jgi:prevent-host-death family protein
MKIKDNTTVSSFDAKTHLSQLIQDVEKGKSITITRRGKPVARLVPVQEENETPVEYIVEELASVRRRIKGVFDVEKLIREGRKY